MGCVLIYWRRISQPSIESIESIDIKQSKVWWLRLQLVLQLPLLRLQLLPLLGGILAPAWCSGVDSTPLQQHMDEYVYMFICISYVCISLYIHTCIS